MEVWHLISPILPQPNKDDRGYDIWVDAYVTIYIALKELEEKEQK